MLFRGDIPTPALLLDLDAFEDNINKMASHLKARDKAFRPHGKTHKCPEVAQALIDAGAIGCCAARLSEAEVFAEHGIPGTAGHDGGDRQATRSRARWRSRDTAPDTIFVRRRSPERPRHQRRRPAGAASRSSWRSICSSAAPASQPGQPAVELAQLIDSLPNVAFVGLQSYDGAGRAHHAVRRARQRAPTTTMAQGGRDARR